MEVALLDSPMSKYRKECGAEPVIASVAGFILSIAQAYNIKDEDNLSEEQAVDCAKNILFEYHWLKLAELSVFARNAVMGKYGSVFGRIDQPVIFEWLNKYNESRGLYLKKKREAESPTIADRNRFISNYMDWCNRHGVKLPEFKPVGRKRISVSKEMKFSRLSPNSYLDAMEREEML